MSNTFTFTPAHATDSFLRMALTGVSGSGKTWSALEIATGLADGGKIAVIDTEHGSASKYRKNFTFDTLNLDQHDPRFYVQAIEAAAAAGYKVLIIDSLSHAWSGRGGALELVDQAAARSQSKNSFTAWKDITPLQNQLIDAIIRTPVHIIATMRSKSEYVVETNDRGKTAPRKVGMAPIQGKDMEYEFDVVGDMDQDHNMIIVKSRCTEITDQVIKFPTAELGKTLAAWLSDEIVETPPQAPAKPVPDPAIKDAGRLVISKARQLWGDNFKEELASEIGQKNLEGLTLASLQDIVARLDTMLEAPLESETAEAMGDDGSTEIPPLCDSAKYMKKYFAIAGGTAYKEAAGRASFVSDATQGAFDSLSKFLNQATTPEAQKLCTDLQSRITADKGEMDDSDPFAPDEEAAAA